MRVKVTADHIARGRPCLSGECPVALAIGECIVAAGVENPMVWVSYRRAVVDGDRFYDRDLPTEAKEFIARFDTGKAVKPFEFDLDIALW